MTTSSEFTKLWNMKFEEKEHTHKVVCASTGISIIGHGEEEANKIAEYMTRKHHTKYVVEANES